MRTDGLVELGSEQLRGGVRWLPPQSASPLGDSVFEASIPPVAIIREAALEHNIRLMQEYARREGVALAPHGKTTMAPEIWQRQLRAGAWGLTAATVAQARVMASLQVPRILLANEVVDRRSLDLVCSGLAPGFDGEIICLIDSLEGLGRIDSAVRSSGTDVTPVVLIEIGVEGRRTGCRSYAEALELARAARQLGSVELGGIECFEGVINGTPATQGAAVDRHLDDVASIALRLLDAGCLGPREDIILSAGGSAYFDRVVHHLHPRSFLPHQVTLVLRSGCYVTHDSSFYDQKSPLGSSRSPQAERLQPALEIWACVVSTPEERLSICAVGKRDFGNDYLPPEPLFRRDETGIYPATAAWSVSELMDHHTFVTHPAGHGPRIGEWIGFGINHPCTTFDKWGGLALVDDEYTLKGVIATCFQ